MILCGGGVAQPVGRTQGALLQLQIAITHYHCVGAGHARESKLIGKPGNQALRRGRVSLPNHVYLITTATLHRQRFFEDFAAACETARCFSDSNILGDACLLAWVLMPDHVHWLLRLGVADNLNLVVNRLKSASARKTNKVLHRSGALWQSAYYDRALRAEEDLHGVARYLVANPMRAGLVKRIGDYPFWNAVWL